MRSQRYHQIYIYENRHWWYRGRRRLLFEVLKTLPNKGELKILDFGCGPGSTINLLNQFDEVFGVDIEPQAISYCLKKGLKNVKLIRQGKALPFNSNSFDVITCMDVLEHIENETATLLDLRRVLKKDGLLIVSVPAFPFLWGELDNRSHHFRRYKKSELINILKTSGFKVQKVVYFNYLFFIPIAVIRIFQRSLFGRKFYWGVDPIVKNNLMNQFLTYIFYFDVVSALKIQPPFGVSLVALLKKS